MRHPDPFPDRMLTRAAPRPAAEALIRVVRQMRAAQRGYFTTAPGEAKQALLVEAKRLEQSVDALLASYPDADAVPDLFDEAAEEAEQ